MPQRLRGGRVPSYHKAPDLLAGLANPSRYIQLGAEQGAGTALIAALGDMGRGLIDQHRQEEEAAVAAHFARSKLAVDGALSKAALDHGEDAEVFGQYVTGLRSKWLEQVPENYRENAALYFDTEAQSHALKIMGAQRERQTEENKAVLLEVMDAAQNRASAAMRGGEFDAAQREAAASEAFRHQLFGSGMVTAEEFVSMGEKTTFTMTRHRVLGEYDRAMAQGLDTAQSFIDGLGRNENIPVDDRDKLVAELQKTFDAHVSDQTRTADRADRLADKALKERQQAVFADVVSRLNDEDPSNGLTQAQLDQLLVRRDLDHALHSKLSKALNVTDPPRKDDPRAVVQLYQDLEGQSDPDAFKSKALQMYADGLITKPTLDKFRSQADRSESEGQDVKQYRKFVADAIATAGPLAVLDQDTAFRKATAIREFNERVAAGEPPKDVADDVVDRYRLSDPGPTGLPKPRFLDGDRSDLDALENARQATAAAYREGRITKAQAVEESRLIKQLMDMAQARAKQRQALRGERK